MASSSSLPPYAHGMITVAVALTDRVVIATDHTNHADAAGVPVDLPRIVELNRGFVVAGSGLWATADHSINTSREILAAYHPDDTAESFLHRYDRLYRATFERLLTTRFATSPETVLRECFCPLTPPHSLVVADLSSDGVRLTIFEYVPALSDQDRIILTPLIQTSAPTRLPRYVAVGAAAPYVANLDADYLTRTVRSAESAEAVASGLVRDAIAHAPTALGPPLVRALDMRSTPRARVSRSGQGNRAKVRATARNARPFPPVDTRDVDAVHRFVREKFEAMYPNAQFDWLATVFRDVERLFRGDHPAYSPLDLRYHDLEHTLQATVCATVLLAGRHAARVAPRIDAHHFELAVAATLLHDSGYAKLRTDTFGTGAKYTFCHVIRSCAFAATYLPQVGANGSDVETVLGAINCTGPMNEISRLRFPAPVDEVIGCAVATADFLGQMAAADYPDELEILFQEFKESDDFLRLPMEDRMFKSAHDLIARTPHFWHRFVLPKLDSDFRGVYRFLAEPYPSGRNPYLDAVNANIVKIQCRLAERTQRGAPAAATDAPAPTRASSSTPRANPRVSSSQ